MKQPTPRSFVLVISQPLTAPNLYKRAGKTGVGVSSPSISIPQSQSVILRDHGSDLTPEIAVGFSSSDYCRRPL
ncbi:hypothetical protein BHM03_00022423 [Ensete ventricosum]|nr:hypothetical protein BHM03_00022423 [Ensete ventricosum]